MDPSVSKRIINLDVLKCLAMLMVLSWHFFQYGIVESEHISDYSFSNDSVSWLNYHLSQFIIVISSACVNLFVLVSAYFLVTKPVNWRRMGLLWLETVFYGVVIALLFFFLRPGSIRPIEVVAYLFPVITNRYWFLTMYIGMVCLSPFLALAVNSLNRLQYRRLLFASVLLGCTISFGIPLGEQMGVSKGFTLIWFVVLYFWGGYLRRFPSALSSRQASGLFLAVVACAYLFILLKGSFYRHSLSFEQPAYNSFGFFIAIFMFIWFNKRKEIKGALAKGLSKCVPCLMAVYLITEHPAIRVWLWNDLFDWVHMLNRIWFIPMMCAAVFSIFCICVAIDYVRLFVFRVLYMERLVDCICQKSARLVHQICGTGDSSSIDLPDAS